MNAFTAIPYVGGSLGLVAFIVAAVWYAYSARLKQRANIIRSAPAKDRLATVEATAEIIRVDLTGVSSSEKTTIVLEQIKIRRNREMFIALIFFSIALFLTVITIIQITRPPDTPSKMNLGLAPTATPPKATIATDFVPEKRIVCTGEKEENCPGPHDAFYICGYFGSDQQISEGICKDRESRFIRLKTIDGNRCGYSLIEVTCK